MVKRLYEGNKHDKGIMRGCNVMRNKRVGLLILLLVILAIGSTVLAACTRRGTPSAAASGGNKGGGGGGGNTAHMGNRDFLVSTVTIAKGSKLALIGCFAVPTF